MTEQILIGSVIAITVLTVCALAIIGVLHETGLLS